MSGIRTLLADIGTDVRAHLGAAWQRARASVARDPIQIAAYRGFGTAERCLILARVLENEGITAAAVADTRWRNLINTLKRIESDEVPHARVRLAFAGAASEVVADDEGYVEAWVTPAAPLAADRAWHTAELELLEPSPRAAAREPAGGAPVRAAAPVLVPPPSAELAVISDLDDTVIRTDATSLVRMARATLFGNARTRLPFPGVAAFYQALQRGAHGGAMNPVFYVSSSPWNLYDLLDEFLALQGIPAGPLLLRDWDVYPPPVRHRSHKLAAMERVIELYRRLPLILIGDSGQEDPEIYREIVRRYPARVLAIYIRNVTPDPARSAAVRALAAEVQEAGSTLVLADDTLAAARHAAERGWIGREALEAVGAEKRVDEAGAPGTPVDEPGGAQQPTAPTVIVEGSVDS